MTVVMACAITSLAIIIVASAVLIVVSIRQDKRGAEMLEHSRQASARYEEQITEVGDVIGRVGLAIPGAELPPVTPGFERISGNLLMCDRHFHLLEEAVKERGMGHLVPEDDELAAAQFEDAQKQGRTAANFNPMAESIALICTHALERCGPALLAAGETEAQCPLCFLQVDHDRHCADPECDMPAQGFDEWVSHAADRALAFAESEGLVK